MSKFNVYSGSEKGSLPLIQPNDKLNDPRLYFPAKGLQMAVNVALQLNLPLLITGEPGTGKTQLAHHLAHHFDLEKPLTFNSQTTSQAKDLFYRYDALAHFQFAQTQKEFSLDNNVVESRFINYVGLGKAIKENRKAVVLLDEIDKAPRDFPNDILAAIEDLEFNVPEADKRYKASSENRPIIVMTSNSEKNLPDAFLRRVVYYHIEFPKKDELLRIVSAKIDGYDTAALDTLIQHFEQIREGKSVKLRKNPATAELINWAFLLKRADFPVQKLAEPEDLSLSEREVLIHSYSVLAKNREDLREIQKILRGN